MEEESVQHEESQHQSVNDSSSKPQPKVQGTIVTANGRQITSKLNPEAKAFYPAYLQRKMYREAFSLALKNDHHLHHAATKAMTTMTITAPADANSCTRTISSQDSCNSNTKSSSEREGDVVVACDDNNAKPCENKELSLIGDQYSADEAVKRHDDNDNDAEKDAEKVEETHQEATVDTATESAVEITKKTQELENQAPEQEEVKKENVNEEEELIVKKEKKDDEEMAAVAEPKSNEEKLNPAETPEPEQIQTPKDEKEEEEHEEKSPRMAELRETQVEDPTPNDIPHAEECAEPIQTANVELTHIENGHVGDDASEPIQTQLDADIKDEAALYSAEMVNEAAGDLSNANKGEPQQKTALHAVSAKKSTSLVCTKVRTALRPPTPKCKSTLEDDKKKTASSMTRKIANFSLGLVRKSNTGPIGETATVKRAPAASVTRTKKISETLQNLSTSLKSKPATTRLTSASTAPSAPRTVEHSQSFLSKSTIRLNGAIHKPSSKDAVSVKSNSSAEHSITSRSMTTTHGKTATVTSPLAKAKDPTNPGKTLPRGTVASTLRQSEAKKVNH